MKTQRGWPHDDGGRDCSDAGPNQGSLGVPRNEEEAREDPSLGPSEGTVLDGIPEHSMQYHLQPCPVSSGSVCPMPVWSEFLEHAAQRACYLLLLSFGILERELDLNLRVLYCFITYSSIHLSTQQMFIKYLTSTRPWARLWGDKDGNRVSYVKEPLTGDMSSQSGFHEMIYQRQ